MKSDSFTIAIYGQNTVQHASAYAVGVILVQQREVVIGRENSGQVLTI